MAHDTVPLVDLERLSHAHEVRLPIVATDAFQAAFFKRDTRGTGCIYVEDVRDVLLELGFEPEDGPWLLDAFGLRSGAGGNIAYAQAFLLFQDLWLDQMLETTKIGQSSQREVGDLKEEAPADSSDARSSTTHSSEETMLESLQGYIQRKGGPDLVQRVERRVLCIEDF